MNKLTKPFHSMSDGEIYPTEFADGDDCPTKLQAGARASGALADGKSSGGPDQEEKAELIAKLEAAGITFDKRWGVDKLAAALADGKKE